MSLRLVPAIHRATHRIGLYLAALPAGGLSQGEAHILALLADAGSATIAELHEGLAHKRSTLTSILDRLAERGLVTRAVGASDRRTFVVSLTARGRTAARRVYKHLADLERAVEQGVSAEDVQRCLKVLAAVTAFPASSTRPRSRRR